MNQDTFTGINVNDAAAAMAPPPPPGPVPAGPSASPYDDLINRSAAENNLDPVIFRKQLVQESGLDPNAVNPRSGAEGISQFMPKVSRALGINPKDPAQAIPMAAQEMRRHLNANNESYPLALAAYNWGEGNLKKYGFDKRPPETRKYIDNIIGPQGVARTVVGSTPPAPPAPAQASTFTGINVNDVQAQGQGQTADTFTGINVNDVLGQGQAPQAEAPPWYDIRDVPGSLFQGMAEAASEGGQLLSGQAFTDQPQQPQQPPRSFFGETAYGLGRGAPTIAGAIAGTVGGAALGGPLGAIAGGALGGGGAAFLQALPSGYTQGRQQGMDHDQAVDYAIRRAITEGGINAAAAPLFGAVEALPIKSAISKWLLSTVGVQPLVGTTTRVVEPMVTGDKPPTAEELLRGVGQDIAAGTAISAGHAIVNRVLPQRPALGQELRGALQSYLDRQREGTYGPPPDPGPPVPAAAVLAHAETRMAALKDAAEGSPEYAERRFLEAKAKDPEALAQFYRVSIAPEETVPPPAVQGEPAREPVAPVAPAETPRAAAAAPEPGAGPVLANVPGERLLSARDAGDQGRDVRAAVLPGEAVPAERPPADGNVRAPTVEDRLGAPQEEWRAVKPGEVFPPGRSYRMNVSTGQQEVLEPRLARAEEKPPAPTGERAAEIPAVTAPRPGGPGSEAKPAARLASDTVQEEGTKRAEEPTDENLAGGAAWMPIKEDAVVPAEPSPDDIEHAHQILDPYSDYNKALRADLDRVSDDATIYDTLDDDQIAEIKQGQREQAQRERLWANEVLARAGETRQINKIPLGQAGQREIPPGQAGQAGQAERALPPENLPRQKPDQRRVTSADESASARPAQGDLFADEQPLPAAGEGEIAPEEAPIDVRTAVRPQDQLRLDALNAQIEKLSAQPGDHTAQIEKLTATRDKLIPQDLLAKRQPPPRKAIPTGPPKPLGAEKDFHDYKYQNGTPVFRDAFVEYAIKKKGMSQDQAEDWANQAINLRIKRDPNDPTKENQIDILHQQVKEKFKFADVVLDPKLSDYDTRNFLLDFHRAATDMMHALGFPLDMASLNGRVRLELNAIGKKTPFGSYTPSTRTIAVHGRANVFGHEWGHAFDHDIVDTALKYANNPGYLATQLGRMGALSPSNPLELRIGHLINTLWHDKADLALKRAALQIKAAEVTKAGTPTLAATKAQAALKALETGTGIKGMRIQSSEYRKQARAFGGDPDYWGNEAELLARSIEAYIARIMEQAGVDPRGVVLPDEAYLANNDKRLRMTFPKQQERADIFAAIDHVMDGYRQTVLAGSPRAAQASRGGISDPKNWAKTAANQKQMGPIKTLIYRIRNKNDTLARTALTDPSRPDPGGNHALRRAQRWASSTFNSRMGVLEGMYHMYTSPRAKAAIKSIMDRLGHVAGSGEYTGWDTIEERAHNLIKKAMGQYTNALVSNGFDPQSFTKEQGAQLRHVMTTGDSTYPVDPLDPNSRRVPIDVNIIRAAGPLRTISDRFLQDLHNAGIEVGHSINGHFMRLYDQVKIHSDPNGFVKAATALHKRMFEDEVGNPGDSPDKLYEQWMLMNSEQRNNMDPAVQSAMRALKQNLEDQRALVADMQANGVTAAKQAQFLKLQQDAEQLAIAHHDAIGDVIADANAENWLNRVRTNYAHDFEHNGPGGNFLNKRTLPPEADQIMREYMITDPMTVLPRYYESAARKIAYAERFGGKNEIRKQLEQDLIDGGVMGDDHRLINKIIDSVAGRTNNEHSRDMAKAANWIHAGAALGLLGRSAYSTLAEPFVIALSQGSMRAGLKSFGAVFGNIMRTGSARDRALLADFIGITTSAMQDDIIMSRVSADYSDSPMLGKFMSRYYRTIGLTQMTNWNRRAAMAGADWLLNKYSRDILSPGTSARARDARDIATRQLNEFGIAPSLHAEFAKWKSSLNGMPSIDTVDTHRFGSAYARAMRRIVDRSVIDPKKIERPLATDDKWTGLLFQFQSFNYGFQRNVIDPMMRRIGHAYEQGKARGGVLGGGLNAAWSLSHTGSIVGAYVAINMLTTALRQYIFNKDDWDKHEADDTLGDYITDLAMQRSGLGGTMDPVVQLWTNLRYNQDLASILEGPGIKWIAKNGYDVLMGAADQARVLMGGQQDETNTRPHEMVKGLYNLIGVPLEAIMATKLGAFGPLGNLAGGALYQYGSSPQAAESAATAVTGYKGVSLAQGGAAEDDLGGGFDKLEGLDSLDETGGGAGDAGQDLGIAGAIPWGLADDFIMPLWKVTRPIIGAIPKRIKQAAALGATAYEGADFYNRMQEYRDLPPPPPK